MKKFMHQIMAVLLIAVMLLPFAGNAATAYAEETHKGSVTFTASGDWVEKEVSINELLGSVAPEKVKAIKFTGDVAFSAGYNTVDHIWEWSTAAKSYTAKNIALDGWYAFKFALTANDGKSHTINWEVLTEEAAAGSEGSASVAIDPADYTGDYTMGYKFASSDFANFDGEVRVTFDFARTGEHQYYQYTMIKNIEGWPKLGERDYAELETPINDWGFIELSDDSVSTVSFVLSEKLVKELAGGVELGVQVYGIVVGNVKLTAIPKATATPTPTPSPTPTPLPKTEVERKEVGGELVITDAMADKNGTVMVQNAEYDAIVVERGAKIKTVYLKNVGTASFQVESGADYTVWTRDCDLGDVTVAAPAIEGISMKTLRQMLDAKQPITLEQLAQYATYSKNLKLVQDKAVTVVLEGYCTVDAMSVEANAKVDFSRVVEEKAEDAGLELFAEEELPNLVISNGLDNAREMKVRLTGYKGNVEATLSDTQNAYTYLYLTLKNSQVEFLSCEGTDGSFYIAGSGSTVEAVVADNVKALVVGLAAENVIISDATKGADISIYDKVGAVIAGGEENDIVLATAAQVKKADVTGNNIRIYGYGLLGETTITGKGANVAVRGASITGENNSAAPKEMSSMAPDVNTSSGTSSSVAEEEEESGPIYTFKYDAANTQPKYSFLILDYLPDYQSGETVKITLKVSSNSSWYGGGIGGNDLSGWVQSQFSNADGDYTTWAGETSITLIEKYDGYGSIDVSVWWWGDSAQVATQEIYIDEIIVERVEIGDDTTGDDTTGDDTTGDDTTGDDTTGDDTTGDDTTGDDTTGDDTTGDDTTGDDTTGDDTTGDDTTGDDTTGDDTTGDDTTGDDTTGDDTTGDDTTGDEETAIYTFTYNEDAEGNFANEKYEFKLNEYLTDVQQYETVKITIKFDTDISWGGAVQANTWNAETSKDEWTNLGSLGGSTFEATMAVPYGAGWNTIQLQTYWMGGDSTIDVTDITVERVVAGDDTTEDETTPIYTFTYNEDAEGNFANEKYEFKLNEYLTDVQQYETVKITIKFDTDISWGGAVQANTWNAETSKDEWTNLGSLGSSTFEATMAVPYGAGWNTIQLQTYWMGGDSTIDVTDITVERVTE